MHDLTLFLVSRAGQWVDLFIPGVDKVGGFSMCSDPLKLEVESQLDLAVKHSHLAPAHWLHTKAEVGSKVSMRVGGDFHYPNGATEEFQSGHNLLLVGGGVGINPLASILFHLKNLTGSQVGASLLYSARTGSELVFREEIDAACKANPKLEASYFVTREQPKAQAKTSRRRINGGDLEGAVAKVSSRTPTFCYLCGPNSMIRSMLKILADVGVPEDRIFYELWR